MRHIFVALLLLPLSAFADPASIKIGAIQPLTGDGAFWGESARRGIELAVRDFNSSRKSGVPQIEVIFEDDKCDPKLAVTAFQKLVDLDHVAAIVGPGCSAGAMSTGPLAAKYRVPILTCTEADGISAINDYVFRMWVPSGRVGKRLAQYASEKLKAKRLAILAMQNDYGLSYLRSGKEEFERLGGQVVAEELYIPSTADLKSELLRIKAKRPDAILLGSYIKDGLLAVKQLREMKIDLPILAGSALNTAEFLGAVGPNGDGIIIGDLPDTVTTEFRERWKREFSSEWPGMGSCAGMGYDSIALLGSKISQGARDGAALRSELASTSGFKGVDGTLTFDRDRNLTLSHQLFVLKGGKTALIPE